MPYIADKERRKTISYLADLIIMNEVEPNGELNCLLFMLYRRTVGKDPSYNKIKNFRAELTECAEEIRRRFLVSHEMAKITLNGDVE